MIAIRKALVGDVPWLIEQMKEFISFAEYDTLFDVDYLPFLVQDVVANHFVIIAYEQSTNERVGMLAAILGKNPYNPKKTILSELAWWVVEKARSTRAGIALLTTYSSWGRKNADFVTMSTLKNSPLKPAALEKRGFRFRENTFVWEKA